MESEFPSGGASTVVLWGDRLLCFSLIAFRFRISQLPTSRAYLQSRGPHAGGWGEQHTPVKPE